MSWINYLGRSEKGVYLASLSDHRLRVWILQERDGEIAWILKHDNDLKRMVARQVFDWQACGPWILEDVNYDYFRHNFFLSSIQKVRNGIDFEGKYEWNSDNDDDIIDKGYTSTQCYRGHMAILGFHPFKEIVFLSSTEEYQTLGMGLAYHLGSSNLQVLGNVCPTGYSYFNQCSPNDHWPFETFPYTPCWIDEFPKHN
jgi:hypothetical protein